MRVRTATAPWLVLSAPFSWWRDRIIHRVMTAVKSLRRAKPAKIKKAEAYRLADCIVIYSSSNTTTGLSIASPPYLRASKENAVEIGHAALQALNASLDDVRHPASWDKFFDPVARAAGVKSWQAFAKAAKGGVLLRIEDGAVILTPMKNLGPKDGFGHLQEKERRGETAPTELGKAIIATLDDAESDIAAPRGGIN